MAFFNKKPAVKLLAVGLGNPGREYGETRHNVGFLSIDALAAKTTAAYWKTRCEALVSELELARAPLALAKPQTFMNRSGRAIKGLLKHFNLETSQLLVIHDDLDIPEHCLRLKMGGGHGGHNGLRDINAAVGDGYQRLRIGIGRPPGQLPADRFVLQRLSGEALEQLRVDAQLAATTVVEILEEGFTAAQNRLNAR